MPGDTTNEGFSTPKVFSRKLTHVPYFEGKWKIPSPENKEKRYIHYIDNLRANTMYYLYINFITFIFLTDSTGKLYFNNKLSALPAFSPKMEQDLQHIFIKPVVIDVENPVKINTIITNSKTKTFTVRPNIVKFEQINSNVPNIIYSNSTNRDELKYFTCFQTSPDETTAMYAQYNILITGGTLGLKSIENHIYGTQLKRQYIPPIPPTPPGPTPGTLGELCGPNVMIGGVPQPRCASPAKCDTNYGSSTFGKCVKPTADDQEDFGAFSISAAVRGSYCQHCGRRRYEDIPGVY